LADGADPPGYPIGGAYSIRRRLHMDGGEYPPLFQLTSTDKQREQHPAGSFSKNHPPCADDSIT